MGSGRRGEGVGSVVIFMESESLIVVQIGMHAGRGGGVDRYFDGLMRSLTGIAPNCRGYVFGESDTDLPSNVSLLGSRHQSIWKRMRAIHHVVRQSLTQHPKSRIVCVTHFALYGLPCLPLLLRYKRLRLVSHFHGPWAEESAAEGSSSIVIRSKRLIERMVLRRSSHVVTVSEAFRKLAMRIHSIPPNRVTAVHAGVIDDPFTVAAGVTRESARERLGWPRDTQVVFCVRRLAHRMGLDRLIDAFAQLHAEFPLWRLMIGGKGQIETELRERIASHGLSDEVISMAGFISEADLPYAYRAAEFSIVPSVALEGFGLVAVESLAAGTPVLVTPVGGMPEVVSPLCKKLVLSGFEKHDLVEGLRRAMSGQIDFPNSEACTDYVEKHFDWKEVSSGLTEIYERASTKSSSK